jgi:hypothetical protein
VIRVEAGIHNELDGVAAEPAYCGHYLFRKFTRAGVYQQGSLVAHFHGNAPFDKWHTSLANTASLKDAGLNPTQACQQAADLMKTASTLDVKGFRAYAANLAANASARYTKCGR